MAAQFVSKFNIGDQTIEVKDASARITASTASTNASNALNKVLELEKTFSCRSWLCSKYRNY